MSDDLITEHRLKLHLEEYVSAVRLTSAFANLSGSVTYDRVFNSLYVRLHTHVWEATAEDTLSVPANWWEHFKQRWYPAWMLNKWPVKKVTYRARASFPELRQAVPPGVKHINYKWVTLNDLPSV